MPAPFDYTLNAQDPVLAMQAGMAFGQNQRMNEQAMVMNDQTMQQNAAQESRDQVAFDQGNLLFDQQQQDRAAAMEKARAMNTDLVALSGLVAEGNVSANDFAAIATKYPDLADEMSKMWDGLDKERKDTDVANLFKGISAIKAGRPDLAIQMLEDRATAAENAGDQMEADIARATAEAIKADPSAGLTTLGLLLQVVDPDAAVKIFGDAPKPTDDMREYEFARSQGYQGTFQEYQQEMKKAGASTTIVDMTSEVGTIPQGYEMFTDPATGARSMRPIPGGPEDTSKKVEAREGMAEAAGEAVITAAMRALEADQNRLFGGALGALTAYNPSTPSAEVYRQVDALKAMASLEALTAMRNASPTGAGMGNPTDRDAVLLEQKHGALDPKSPTFARDLKDYTKALLITIHGAEAGTRIFEETIGKATASPAASVGGSGSQGQTGQVTPQGVPSLDDLLREAEGL